MHIRLTPYALLRLEFIFVISLIACLCLARAAIAQLPGADNLSVSTSLNTPVKFAVTASATNGHSLTYSIVTPPANGALGGTAPSVTYAPNSGYAGPDSFTFTANDGPLVSNLATVTVDIVQSADWFLYIPTIPGESVDENHRDWIGVLGYVMQPDNGCPSGGMPPCFKLSIVKQLDRASPILQLYVAALASAY